MKASQSSETLKAFEKEPNAAGNSNQQVLYLSTGAGVFVIAIVTLAFLLIN
jgi:hypothetical protein